MARSATQAREQRLDEVAKRMYHELQLQLVGCTLSELRWALKNLSESLGTSLADGALRCARKTHLSSAALRIAADKMRSFITRGQPEWLLSPIALGRTADVAHLLARLEPAELWCYLIARALRTDQSVLPEQP